MSAHTPGPWKLHFWAENVGVGSDRQKARDCESIAVVPRGPETGTANDRATADANARLIAAAPELLEALETTLGNLRDLKHSAFAHVDTIDEWIAVVADAIAKTRGGK